MRFLVIGEIGLDRFVWCSITRLCPEGPVPVVNPRRETDNYGMAGNVVANLRSLGAEHVDSVSPPNTIIKTRYLDEASGQLVLRVDEHDVVPERDRFNLSLDLPESAADYDAVIVSEYGKGYVDEMQLQAVARWAALSKVPTLLDTKKVLGQWSREFTYVKLNEREYQVQLKAGLQEPQQYCQNLIVTRGPQGSWWVNGDLTVPTVTVPVADVSGCGDVYLAAFTLELIAGKSVGDSMRWANLAATLASSKRGVVSVLREEVCAFAANASRSST